MTPADKLYEQALALREKATPGEWKLDKGLFEVWGPKGPGYGLVCHAAPYCPPLGKNSEQAMNAALIVVAVNLLDALPALRTEWEREARRAALEEAAKICDGLENEFDMPGGVSAAGARKINRAAREIRALQQPAAQAEEERT